MSAPVPAPRSYAKEVKKPVPTPRKLKLSEAPKEEHTNTFSRKVRSLSNASKQIAEDIGEMVQDRKKAVIEGTRQSVRRITRRFNSSNSDNTSTSESPKDEDDLDQSIDMFNSISFQSPIASLNRQNIYNNIDDSSSSSDDYISCPPPKHPPPPLPEDGVYDAPSSVASSSTSTDLSNNPPQIPENYECVFPSYAYNSDSESCIDMTAGTLDRNVDLSRSGSWKFYDSVNKTENIYNDISNGGSVTLTPQPVNQDLESNCDSVEIRNSLYENHEIMEMPKTRPSESVIIQFDPLRNCAGSQDPTSSSDIKVLEELLQGDLYGNFSSLQTLDNWSISNDSDIAEDFVNPPPPPVRTDSLPEEEQLPPYSPTPKSRTSWFNIGGDSAKSTPESKRTSGWLKQMKEVLEKSTKTKDAIVQRPELGIKAVLNKKGMLYKVQGGPVEDLFGEYSGRWCVLQNSSLICYSDSNCDSVKEHFPADSILSIQILQDPKYKYKYDNDDLHCFELNTTGKSRGGHIYGSRDVSERRIWMQYIAENLTSRFSTKITSDFTRLGWAYIREGVSGKWMGAWLVLTRRTLYYLFDNQPKKSMDLRKVRCILLQVYQENDSNPRTNDKGPNMVVDSPNITLYIRMWTSRETKVWCHIVKVAAHNNGANLDQQQLTKNDIPVIVEKCINFIYAHGSMSEGIYRRPGVGSAISDLLAKFRKDSWAVQLTNDKYTEHDVATALKRFFRDLPEPLLSSNQRQYFYQVSLVKNKDDKIRMYKAALDHLPPISYKSAKKLFGHLHFISSQSGKNLMTVENLAAIWGPTLMHFEDKEPKSIANNGHHQDSIVVGQLIDLYRSIFPEEPGEIEQEKLMLQVLEKYTKSPQGAVNKKAGDFRVWIYFNDKEGQTFNVAIGPNKTAYDVCAELSSKVDVPVHQLTLEEVVLNDKLTRPIHHSEKILDVVLRWGYWDECDRKDNHLIITKLSKYLDFIQEKLLPVISGELKFADCKTRSFKLFMFEFSQAKLNYFKDKTCETKLQTWNVEDITWYLGHETKRNPQSRWTATFIETNTAPKRTKTNPYFGNILAWNDPSTRANWLAALIRARYADSLTSPALHVNLLSNC